MLFLLSVGNVHHPAMDRLMRCDAMRFGSIQLKRKRNETEKPNLQGNPAEGGEAKVPS